MERVWSSGGRGRPRIGREEVWHALLARRQKVIEGVGGLTLIEGTGGVGKSTFLTLLGEEARAAGFRVGMAKASWVENPPPYRIIDEVLRALAPGSGPRDPSRRPARPAPAAAGVAASPSSRFKATRAGAAADNPRSELASDQLQLLGTFADPLFAAAASSPVLILLDDIHWADEASRSFLTYLIPRIQSRPIWIVVTSSVPDDAARGRPDPLAALRARTDIDRIALRGLNQGEVQEFVQWVLPQKPTREAEIRRLYEQSRGIPAKVVQMLLPAPEVSRPGAKPGDRVAEDERRVANLDAAARRLLNLALVAGPEFSLKQLAVAAGLDEERTVEYFERFVKLEIIHELEDGRFAFDRDETRDRLYGQIGARLLRGYHQRIAAALLETGSTDIRTIYSLARHTYLAGMLDAAVEYNRRAAAYAAEQLQPGVSLLYLRLAVDALTRAGVEDSRTEASLRLEIAGQQVKLGEADAAERALEEIRGSPRLRDALGTGDRALLGMYLARVMADRGRWEEAEQALAEIPPDPEGKSPSDLRRSVHRLRGEMQFYRSDYEGALAAYEASLLIARLDGNPREIASDSIRRATALTMFTGRESEAIDEYRTAVAQLAAVGDRVEAAFGSLCLGAQLTALGRHDEARAALKQAVDLSDAAHDVRRSGWAHLNLADLEFSLQRPVPATEEARVARRCFEQVEEPLGIARVALTEGRLATLRGEFEAAQRSFETARGIYRAHDLKADEMEVELRSAELELARRDELGARERLARLAEEGFARLRPDLLAEGQQIARRLRPPVTTLG